MRFLFGPFVLDPDARQLTRGSDVLHLTPKAFDLLAALVATRPRVLTKGDLQARLWPETYVSDANLSNLVAEVRAALGDDARAPAFVRTAYGSGYAFCATVREQTASDDASAVLGWFEWSDRRIPLTAGTHVVGRDEGAAIRLDHVTVSRGHARVVVNKAGATIEDTGSKNGTFRQGVRLVAPAPLADGDTIAIGSVVMTYRARGVAGTTRTHVAS
ncbi:MAG: winged helix-turn-helix domain-containing protein [Vicinamibacterales bacterium]